LVVGVVPTKLPTPFINLISLCVKHKLQCPLGNFGCSLLAQNLGMFVSIHSVWFDFAFLSDLWLHLQILF